MTLYNRNRLMVFDVGKVYGGVKINDKKVASAAARNRYFVTYLCCGRSGELSHSGLRHRVVLGRVKCQSCMAKANRANSLKAKEESTQPQTVYDATGYPWQKLTKLGPRFGGLI
jgi:hypothetical protein